jgi:hypothetical protein
MVSNKTRTTKATRMVRGVDDFMASLEHPLKAEIEAIRKIILDADTRIQESIKWNAPSFFITEHFATLKLWPPETVQIVFHRGAKIKDDGKQVVIDDPSNLLKWVTRDRCLATFLDIKDVEAKRTAINAIVKQWIEQQ